LGFFQRIVSRRGAKNAEGREKRFTLDLRGWFRAEYAEEKVNKDYVMSSNINIYRIGKSNTLSLLRENK